MRAPMQENRLSLIAEIASFLASGPTPEQILAYRPPQEFQKRADELLALVKSGMVTEQERSELGEYVNVEHLMRLTCAGIRARAATGAGKETP